MTDHNASAGSGSPEAAPDNPVSPSSQPADANAPAADVAGKRGKRGGRGAIVIIGGLVVFLAVVLFAVRNNVTADDLKVGDCFNVPSGASAQTVEHHACTESHTAEVFHVAEYTGDGSTYPISLSLNSFVQEACGPVFETYTGQSLDTATDLTVGYFYPSRDSWSSGDRTITCYVIREDEGLMTESVKR